MMHPTCLWGGSLQKKKFGFYGFVLAVRISRKRLAFPRENSAVSKNRIVLISRHVVFTIGIKCGGERTGKSPFYCIKNSKLRIAGDTLRKQELS